MHYRRAAATGALSVIFLSATTIRFASAQDARPSFEVEGAVQQKITLTLDELSKMPRATLIKTVMLPVGSRGACLHEILKKAGVPVGGRLRGKALATYVLAEARNGY